MSKDIILTGIPRSGTTLTCHLLNKVPNTVALHEPLTWQKMHDPTNHGAICDHIDEFFRQTRRQCLESGTVVTQHFNGAVPDNPTGNYSGYAACARFPGRLFPGGDRLIKFGLRRLRVTRGEIKVGKPLTADFTLCVKHTAPFTALLPELLRRHGCFAVVRHPVSVLTSWGSIRFALQDGHHPEAERIQPQLRRDLQTITDRIERQIYLLSWFCRTYLALLPPERVIRYEDIVRTGGKALGVVVPEAASLYERLESRNTNRLYDRELMGRVAERLKASDGPIWELYRKDSIDELIDQHSGA